MSIENSNHGYGDTSFEDGVVRREIDRTGLTSLNAIRRYVSSQIETRSGERWNAAPPAHRGSRPFNNELERKARIDAYRRFLRALSDLD